MIERFHLEVVRAVRDHGSVTAAAPQLHLTQSAVSHAMRRLEEQLGTDVWAREGRRLRLTPAGEALLGLAERLLPQFEHTEALVRDIVAGRRGSLRIGMECHPCYEWLLKVVSPYLEHWPDVDVDVRQGFQFDGVSALAGHDLDVLVTPDPIEHPALEFQPVFDYEQVLVVGTDHPLASYTWIPPDALKRETLITYPVATERLDIFTRFLLPAQVTPARHRRIETTAIMLKMVAAGRGVTALPRWLVDEYAERQPLVPLKLGKTGLPKQIHLGLRADEGDLDYLRGFVDLARNTRSARSAAPQRTSEWSRRSCPLGGT